MLELKQRDHQARWKPTRSHYRLKRSVFQRLALVLGLCCAVQSLRLHVWARSSLEVKYTTTSFENGAEASVRYSNLSTAFDRNTLLGARPSWQPLGSGCEGSTFSWDGLVIKTYKPERSPFRNCVASSLIGGLGFFENDDVWSSARWPTEIPAQLLLGTEPGFLSAKDVFFASSSPTQEAQWHLVTPLVEGGTLQYLPKHALHNHRDGETSIRDLDIRFRPNFNEVLVALQRLHTRRLCHDDVKPDNVFIGASSPGLNGPWLLGDLGNVRQLSHPYHASRVWSHSNSQLADCRANDALRAIKTYLQFLRQASSADDVKKTTADFDIALSEAKESWARLFWLADHAGNDLRVDQVLQWASEEENPINVAHLLPLPHRSSMGAAKTWLLWSLVGWQGVHARAADSALKIAASEGWTRKLALTWLLGVPVGRC